jgi:hypothetical protein
VFLQHPVEVNGVLGVGSKGTHSSEVVLPDILGLGALGVFHACPPKGALESCQPILPRGDGAFPTIQLSLPGEELLL